MEHRSLQAGHQQRSPVGDPRIVRGARQIDADQIADHALGIVDQAAVEQPARGHALMLVQPAARERIEADQPEEVTLVPVLADDLQRHARLAGVPPGHRIAVEQVDATAAAHRSRIIGGASGAGSTGTAGGSARARTGHAALRPSGVQRVGSSGSPSMTAGHSETGSDIDPARYRAVRPPSTRWHNDAALESRR
jgi:hypothetical protein